jgi:structural maintenance of chromosome 2
VTQHRDSETEGRADRQELAKGGKVQALTEAVNALEKELVKTKTQLEISEGTVKDDAKRVQAAKAAVKEVSTVHLPICHRPPPTNRELSGRSS